MVGWHCGIVKPFMPTRYTCNSSRLRSGKLTSILIRPSVHCILWAPESSVFEWNENTNKRTSTRCVIRISGKNVCVCVSARQRFGAKPIWSEKMCISFTATGCGNVHIIYWNMGNAQSISITNSCYVPRLIPHVQQWDKRSHKAGSDRRACRELVPIFRDCEKVHSYCNTYKLASPLRRLDMYTYRKFIAKQVTVQFCAGILLLLSLLLLLLLVLF